ncbi:MAG: A/G-specific adenine glycosylase, partial [Cyanobacteriota bacterium]
MCRPTWLSELSPAQLRSLRELLLSWWRQHGRHSIPWKLNPGGGPPEPSDSLDPYPIWVAEVMLQQTQLQVVLPFWQRWREALPTLAALADAEEHDVLLLWQGLGYYSRARRLLAGARVLHEQITAADGVAVDSGAWPQDLDSWLALPGIGRSTAGSILSSAFNLPFAILDGNVKRVLARLMACERPPVREQAKFWHWSEQLLDPERPRDFNQSLMDLGATVCT